MSTLENQVDTLQKQVRNLRRALIAVCGGAAILGLVAATVPDAVPDLVRAKKIQVVDDDGKVLVGMGENEHGGVLVVANGDQQEIVVLGAASTGGILGINNNEKVANFILEAKKDGGFLTIKNSADKASLGLGSVADGHGIILVNRPDGKPSVEILSLTDGKGGAIAIKDGAGKVVRKIP